MQRRSSTNPPLPPPSHPSQPSSLDPNIWLACAGISVRIPTVNSTVYYFLQGHLDHASSTPEKLSPDVYSTPFVLARIVELQLLADPNTDEVFVKLVLDPINDGSVSQINVISPPPDTAGEDDNSSGDENAVVAFAKILTPSDANNGGGFCVPRLCAESIFPPLNFQDDPPFQNLRMTDVHGNVWEFRHIFRGMPRSHLLTTGWSKFVNFKNLAAGDSVVFMKNSKGEIFVGVRRAKQSRGCGSGEGGSDGSGTERCTTMLGVSGARKRDEEGEEKQEEKEGEEKQEEEEEEKEDKEEKVEEKEEEKEEEKVEEKEEEKVEEKVEDKEGEEKQAEKEEEKVEEKEGEEKQAEKEEEKEGEEKPEEKEGEEKQEEKEGFSRNGNGKLAPEKVAEAAELAVQGKPFEVVYYPSAGWSDFVVKAGIVDEARKVMWSPGMRVKMAAETEDSSRMCCYQGTVSAVCVPENGQWCGSPWKMLQVAWDEPEILQNAKLVSPWQVELVSTPPALPTALTPTQRVIAAHGSSVLTDGEEDPFSHMTGYSNLTDGQLNWTLSSYGTIPVGMQGARHDFFSTLDFYNFSGDMSRLNLGNSFGNNSAPNLNTLSTETNIGSSQSDNLSPDSQGSLHSFGIEYLGTHNCNSTEAGSGSFQLFGATINAKQPIERVLHLPYCTKQDSCQGCNEIKAMDKLECSLAYSNMLDRLDGLDIGQHNL